MDLEILKVLGADNPADSLTKYLERIPLEKHMGRIRVYPEEGRAASAPQVIAQITGKLGKLEDGTAPKRQIKVVEEAASKEEC